jgi:hypothetical protein
VAGVHPRTDAWVIFGRPIIDRYHADLSAFVRDTGKLMLLSSGMPLPAEVEAALRLDHVPVLQDPELCVRALGAIHRAGGVDSGPARAWIEFCRRIPGPKSLDSQAVGDFLTRVGLRLAVSSATPAFCISLVQDKDFGPVFLVDETRIPAGVPARRTVCALPADFAQLEAITRDLQPDGDGSLTYALQAVVVLYSTDPAIATVALNLARDGTVCDATIIPVEP